MPELTFQERVTDKDDVRSVLLVLHDELQVVSKDDVLAVSQVAEKAWVAFVAYVKAASHAQISTHAAVISNARQLVQRDRGLQQVWTYADFLHRFHYAPFVEDVHGGLDVVVDAMGFVLRELKKRTKTLD